MLLAFFVTAATAAAAAWHGPSTLIWNNPPCKLLESPGGPTNISVSAAEALCERTAGCNVINYLPGKDEFQLRACATPSAPTWSVAGWKGYATFALPPPPPTAAAATAATFSCSAV